ncbi:ABC transporter substrate-binding protein [Oligella urethralis]|uniref:ABC transporter substrate-binding protein n=1 Tax=Oligella urethralis TaxID=90245 RepID=UPI0003709957|nr:ABC transporter substrate-binding protein [Oligella urethralis]PMC14879.1 ABC transporter ATP-binding protein [Oligella urethralis]SUA55657.1 Putative thiamine biosynthesis protein HI_0357 [Oligella urethralis]SUA68880.1 Putative thiamine biosynthesis protein HI_0357 [Oligella urethralis]
MKSLFSRKKLLAAGALSLLMSTQALAEDKVTLLLDWFVNPDHAPIIIAEQKGYFKDQDLKVDIQEPADPSMPPKLVAAGKADMAVTYQPQLHMQIDEGLPLTRVTTLIATPLNTLVTLKSSNISSIADLKGKKIGFSVSGFEDVLLSVMLQHHGLTMDDVELVNVNWSLSPSLITGKVDAVIGSYRNFELNQLDIENHPGHAFYVEEEGVPTYEELIIVVNNKDRDHDKYRRFNLALEQAVQFIVNHPDEAWTLFKDYKPAELDDELNRRAWKDTLTRFALRPGALSERSYEAFAKFMQEQKLIKQVPTAVADYAIEP